MSLRARGQGRRESGAFLLGAVEPDDRRVKEFVCYDELDPGALSHGIIEFHAAGFSALWQLCARKKLKVLADVHTHGGADAQQSGTDRAHPMIPVQGHVALILPWYAHCSLWSLKGVGLHVFKGGARWESCAFDDDQAPVELRLW